jgi:hypothetical protein
MSDADLERKLIGSWICYRGSKRRAVLTLKQDGKYSLQLASESFLQRIEKPFLHGFEGAWEAHEKKGGVSSPHVTFHVRRSNIPWADMLGPLKALADVGASASGALIPITFHIRDITPNEVTLRDTWFSQDYGNRWVRR